MKSRLLGVVLCAISIFTFPQFAHTQGVGPDNFSAHDYEFTDRIRTTWNAPPLYWTSVRLWRTRFASPACQGIQGQYCRCAGQALGPTSDSGTADDLDAGIDAGEPVYYQLQFGNLVNIFDPNNPQSYTWDSDWITGFQKCSQFEIGYKELLTPQFQSPWPEKGGNTAGIYMNWNGIPSANIYQVFRASEGQGLGSATHFASTGATDVFDSNSVLTAGKNFDFWVRGCDAYGHCGPVGNTGSGWRKVSSPSGLSATQGTLNDRVALTWARAPFQDGTESYRIYRTEDPNAANCQSLHATVNSGALAFDDMWAQPGHRYYYGLKTFRTVYGENRESGCSTYVTGWKQALVTGTILYQGAGLSGVSISGRANTGSNGVFGFYAGEQPGSVIPITPSKVGFNFSPTSSDRTLNANIVQDFTAYLNNYNICMHVTNAVSGAPVSSATIVGTCSGVTNGSGDFCCSLSHGTSYTLTAQKQYFQNGAVSGVATAGVTQNLSLQAIAPVVTTHPQTPGSPVFAGQNLTLTCAFNNAESIAWQKSVAGGAWQNTGITGGFISFNPLVSQNSGSYRCAGSNAAFGSVYSNAAILDVQGGPSISLQPVGGNFFQNQNPAPQLTCQGSGQGLSYSWFKNGALVGGAQSGTIAVDVSQATNAQTVSYVCRVSNSAGQVDSDPALVRVLGAPRVLTHPQSQTVIAGNSATLSCSADAYGVSGIAVNLQWKKNGQGIGSTSSPLVIPQVSAAQAGSYTCEFNYASAQAPANLTSLSNPGVLTVTPTYSISGRVIMSGQGVSGVTVLAGALNTLTDSSGNYSFTQVQNGSYTMTAVKPGFVISPFGFANPLVVNNQSIADANFNAVQIQPVSARLECVQAIDNHSFVAYFGYNNLNAMSVHMDPGTQAGNLNLLTGGVPMSGLPLDFAPGVHQGVLPVAFDDNETVTYSLNYQGVGLSTVSANASMATGPTACRLLVPEVTNVGCAPNTVSIARATFGYTNPDSFARALNVGSLNYMLPGAQDRGQPSSFLSGHIANAFQVDFPATSSLAWSLNGLNAIAVPTNACLPPPTFTPTATPSSTATPTVTSTATPTPTGTVPSTPTRTVTPTPSATATSTLVPGTRDRCGVLNGDGTSCLGCVGLDASQARANIVAGVVEQKLLLTKASRSVKKLIKNDAKKLSKLKKINNLGAQQLPAVQTLVNAMPDRFQQCTNKTFCQEIDRASVLTQLESRAATLRDLVSSILKLGKTKPRLKKNLQSESSFDFDATNAAIKSYPRLESRCQ